MNNIFKTLLLFLILTLLSCAKDQIQEVSKIKEINQEMEMINSYKEGLENIEKRDYFFASKKFLEAELLYPQSKWAAKSALMASYSFYLQDYYAEALDNLERYILTYPKDKNMAYARFLIAICYYESVVDEKRDTDALINAKEKFEFVLKNYPTTDFALDSKFKLDLILDMLAAKEMYIGRHYIKKSKWIAAINRFKYVLENYQTTVYAEEAIHRLVEIYYKIGLIEESQKYANLLGYNYQSSDWYKSTYKIFNRDYKDNKIKINKKEKKGMIEKFRKLLDL
jgi:outer membrane protein assembly factor BamD